MNNNKIVKVSLFKFNNGSIVYNVRYKSGRGTRYTEKDTLPKTVFNFLFNSRNVESKTGERGSITHFR